MPTSINKWSVASVFNAWGCLRSQRLYNYDARVDEEMFITPKYTTDLVADCIRGDIPHIGCW